MRSTTTSTVARLAALRSLQSRPQGRLARVGARFQSRHVSRARLGIDYVRASRRQGGGGFGALPTGAGALTNTIERQQFTTLAPGRVRLDGAIASATPSPPVRSSIAATRRAPTAAAPRPMPPPSVLNSPARYLYAPVYVENLFRFGALTSLRVPASRSSIRISSSREHGQNRRQHAARHPPRRRTVPLFGSPQRMICQAVAATSTFHRATGRWCSRMPCPTRRPTSSTPTSRGPRAAI